MRVVRLEAASVFELEARTDFSTLGGAVSRTADLACARMFGIGLTTVLAEAYAGSEFAELLLESANFF